MRNSSAAATRSKSASSATGRGLIMAALCSASMFYCSWASALGMGDITLHSALNQPLNADIELIETEGLGPEDIVAKLAPAEEFARAGVERLFFFNDLRFTPVIRGNRGVIHVRSSKPVTEPYLHFLVQLVRPNGDLLHEYTVLLDPATSPAGQAALSSRSRDTAVQATAQSRMPVAPPVALQGKRYSVVGGDTLNSIARRMQGPAANASAGKLADGIKALNPQAFPNGESTALKVGQSLLLPDAVVLPSASPTPSAAPQPNTQPSAGAQRGAEQLTTTAIENQALTKTVEDLRAQVLLLQEQVAGKDKQLTGLQTEIAERQPAAAAAPIPVAVQSSPAATTPTPAVVANNNDDSLLTSPLLLGVVAILLLLLGLVWSVRRNRNAQNVSQPVTAEPTLIKPARTPVIPVYEAPVAAAKIAPVVAAPVAAPVTARPAAQRPAGGGNDALDGVSIYIAYGRFAEAMGILRDALAKQPERTDIRVRLLELLGEQGDSVGFEQEQQVALANGVAPEQVQEIRSRYPKLTPASEPVSSDSALPAAALIAPVTVALVSSAALAQSQPAQMDETTAAALNPEPADEFQLNLDDLSMDADWDLVDPFDTPKNPRSQPEAELPVDDNADFASNLTELPDVQEIPDDRFLSDFEDEPLIVESNSDALDDAFLDGFMDDSADFDLLDLDEEPLSKINQAQVLIDDGDVEAARELLLQVIDDAEEEHQQTARDLLAGL